jgi:hypothetical protein
LLQIAGNSNAPVRANIVNANIGTGAFAEFKVNSDVNSFKFGVGSSGNTAGVGGGGAGYVGTDNNYPLQIYTNAAERLRITNTGNVGIGTTAPAALLDVSGAKSAAPSLTGAYIGLAGPTFTDNSTAASGTAANMAFNAIAAPTLAATNAVVTTTNAYTNYIAGAPKKGTNNTVTNAVALGIGAAAVGAQTNSYGLLVNAQTGATNNYSAVFSGGNVGIGSTAPAQKLDVAGTIRSSSGGFVFPDGTIMTTAVTATTAGASSSTDLNLVADSNASGNGAIVVATNGTERMRVLNSGKVGIGTSIPQSALDVSGGMSLGSYAGVNAAPNNGMIVSGNVGIGTTSPASKLDVEGSGGIILNAGNVGIGATSPSVALDVIGGIKSGGSNSITAQGLHLGWNRSGSEGESWIINQKGLATNGNDGIRFGTSTTSNVVTEWARINGSGNVGIGTTTPLALLDVSGAKSATPSLTGAYMGFAGPTFTDNNTAASGTAANMAFNAIAAPTLASTNATVTTTNA